MAKDKATKATSKKKDTSTTKSKPSKRAKSTSKSSGLSEERIADSDSDNDAPAARTATPKGSKEIPLKSSSTNESTKKSKAVSPPSSDSEESSSAEETAKVVPKKLEGVPAKVNGVKRKAEDKESSDEASSSSGDEAEAEQPQAKKAKATTPTKAASPSSSDNEESSADSEQAKPATVTKIAAPKDKQPAATQQPQSSLQSIPAKPFEPPPGFSALDVEESKSGSHLSKKRLAGKQIWHITAPASVPIKSITEVALDAVTNGTPVLNYRGVDYVLNEDNSYDTKFSNVLLPRNDVYQHAGQSIDRTLRLQQKIELPNLSKKQADLNTGSNAAADIAQASVSDIRPQPKGLKMRYKPPGFGRGDPGMMSGSSEDEGEQTKSGDFQFPKALGAYGAADEPETGATVKSKKDQKRRKSENLIDGDVEMVHGESMPPPLKKKKRKHVDGLERVVSKESDRSQEREVETPEEKARRRELKKLKKEAKKRAKDGESRLETAF